MTTTTASLTLDQVMAWIAQINDSTIDAVLASLQTRHDTLHAQRASAAVVGTHVTIEDVTPAYLVGLEGVIEDADGETASIRLTAASTGRLRFSGQKEYSVGAEMNFLLEGVPASCCYPTAQVATA